MGSFIIFRKSIWDNSFSEKKMQEENELGSEASLRPDRCSYEKIIKWKDIR